MSDLIPIYVHEAGGRYYYDTQLRNDYGWSLGVIAFQAYRTQQPGTILIYVHEAEGHYYYDTQISGTGGWSAGKVAFYAHGTPQPGTIPIYRHQVPNTLRYYYDTQIPNNYGWSQGVVAFYALPANTTLLDDILGILGQQGSSYYEKTYQDSSDNKFTLLDTPRLWNQSATVTLPIAGCEELLTQIQVTIGIAHNIVDITLLWQTNIGLPGGEFQQALSQAFWSLTGANRRPFVRIMIGVPIGPVVLQSDLEHWLQQTIELNGRQKISDVPYSILIGCSKQSPESWNHSKIVAVDAVRAVVGGHNLWAKDYLGTTPVHDVSGLIEGSVVSCIHNFCDQVWTRLSVIPAPLLLNGGKFSTPNGPVGRAKGSTQGATTSGGTTRMLSLGRLGFGIAGETTVATNASVSARVMAICRAKQTLRISQQSLYFSAIYFDGGFDFYTLWAIIKSIQAGVNVQIVVSNDVDLKDGGYKGNLPTVLGALASLHVADRLGIFRPSLNPARDDLNAWASAALKSPTSGLPLIGSRLASPAECTPHINELNSKLSVAPLYYAPNVNYWQVGNIRTPAANHAKVYIIDDAHFYVGSDNFYLSGTSHGLQEYGHLIEGQGETRQFIKDYWDKLWEYSGLHTVKATLNDVKLTVLMAPGGYPIL